MQIVTVAAALGLLLWLAFTAACLTLLVLAIRALLKYLRAGPVRREKAQMKKTLGQALRDHRQARHMTQEFVAEAVGVSRQAVSKWESGASDPSTSNLMALAKLYGVPAADLLQGEAPEGRE